MESLPDDIIMDLPVILRTMNRRFRDIIDPSKHWVRYNKKSRAWLAMNNSRVKYLRTKKIDLAWVFPNVVEMKLYYKISYENGLLYEQCRYNLLDLCELKKFEKLRTVILNCCNYSDVTDMEKLKNINFYVRNIQKLTHKVKNIKCLNFVNYYNDDDTTIRLTPNVSSAEILLNHTDYKMILTFNCHQFLTEFMNALLYETDDPEKYRNRLFIDLEDYGCKSREALLKYMDTEKSLIESGIITLIYPSDREKIEDYVDNIPVGMKHILSMAIALDNKFS